MRALSEMASVETVENVLIYISDSLRYDRIPTSVSSLGVSARAIAPSTFTASSIPSILTGRYPHEHKVWGFSEQLQKSPYLLRQAASAGVNVERVWGTEYELHQKPTLTLLNLDKHTAFKELERPFTYVVHDHGGHSPYGRATEDFKPSRAFFEDHWDDEEQIRRLYEEGIDQSVDRFMEIYRHLEESGELEETLIVFTSDHGELLGEYGGLYEHTSPMVPELLEVPMVFCGAGLPGAYEFEKLLSGVDIPPTLLSSQNRPVPPMMQGLDLWKQTDNQRNIRADIWRRSGYGKHIRYAASSVWDDTGGLVVHRGPRSGRFVFALGANLYRAPHAPIVRKKPIRHSKRLLSVHLPKKVTYGEYRGPVTASDLAEPPFETSEQTATVEVDTERLRSLGYIE